jgi:hypothetical protein
MTGTNEPNHNTKGTTMTNTMALPPLPPRTARKLADPSDLISLLQLQHRHKVDLVAPLSALRYNGGAIELGGLDAVIDDAGVTDVNGLYLPTENAESQLGIMLGIPGRYLQKLRSGKQLSQYDRAGGPHVGLLDANVNSLAPLVHGKNVLIRTLYGSNPEQPGTSGIVRGILSDRFGIRDNLDVGLAVLDGMREAGLGADNFVGADLTDNRMWLRIHAPEIFVAAPELLRGYRDPRTGRSSREVGDVVFAGVVVENSETGLGRVKVTPEITVLACTNGMTLKKHAFGQVHVGGRLDEGSVVWSEDTRNTDMELTKKMVRDAIGQFMTRDFVERVVAEITAKAGAEISDPAATIEVVSKKLAYTESESASILAAFIRGGQTTAGGVLQAVTYAAQDVEDPERSNDLAASGIEAMELAASIR